jgi:hypothetical protein
MQAKSGNKWRNAELQFFNINIVHQNCTEFFGVAEDQLPEPKVSPGILNTLTAAVARAANDIETLDFLHLLEEAIAYPESAVDAFAVAVLRLMGYERPGYYLRINENLAFTMCFQECFAQTDVCILSGEHILLLVQEDKRDLQTIPNAQLVAEAIAAFTSNNMRRQALGKDPVAESTISGIIMRATSPLFYKIHVTQDLVACISEGKRPDLPTDVLMYVPVLPDGPNLGMIIPRNRRVILQCYEAFRAIVFSPSLPQ